MMENIEQKLDSVFSKQNRIDNQLKTGSSTVLTHKLEFTAASKPQSSINNMLKDKYTNLAPSAHIVKKNSSATSVGDEGEGLPQPTEVLFPADKLDYSWKYLEGGAGLMNCGNTCFLNAVLQCLIHTPPLTNYLLSGEHFSQCKLYSRDKCILCNLQMLMKRSLTGAADSFSPKWFINNLQYIGRHFRNGRQEDAHEFLRLSLEKMQKCALAGLNHVDKYSKETTVINQIFGGFLRSQVVCLKCRARSNTYDPVLDVSLDIKNVDSIERAFEQFVAPDKLDMENAYKCDKCKQKVPALKRFTIHKSPNVLTIQLKRFQFAQSSFFGGGGKISKHVKYPARLNIRPYMSNKNGPPEIYTLFATIQHEGYSCQSGHYVGNVRCGQRWYHFNDSMKRRTSLQQCLNESSAYILFYMKETGMTQISSSPSSNPAFRPQVDGQVKQNGNLPSTNNHKFIGPVRPQVIKTPEKSSYKPLGFNGIKTDSIKKPVPSPVAPLAERDKIRISFGTKSASTNQPKAPASHTSPKASKPESVPGTPRLVMKIKDGKSFTIETSPDGERRILSDDDEVIAKMNEKKHKKFSKKSSLVPYGDDSSSDSDWGSKSATPVTNITNSNSQKQSNGVMFDQRLNATTSVPGNAHLYETVTVKDKLSHHMHGSSDSARDIKSVNGKTSATTPAKRHFTETLTCVTSPVHSKHVGGGEWHTTEAMLSPSVGSHSSTHSNNSTSDWAVSSNTKLHSNSSERMHEGWTVTPGKNETEKKHGHAEGTSRSDHRISTDIAEKKEHIGQVKSSTNLKRQSMQEQMRTEDTGLAEIASPTTNDKACLLNPEIVKDHVSDEIRLHKKFKKHKKHKKHKHEERERDKYQELSDGDYDQHRHKKKKKKKKKHKRKERDVDSGDEYHSHRHRQEEHSATKRKSEREEETSHKRSRVDSESSSEFEWVEKKVETPLKTSKSVPSTPSQSWDHFIKDDNIKSSSGTNTPMKSASWDGVKASKVASELERLAKHGYGVPVQSWEGNKSLMDVEREILDRANRKRFSDDEYDEEFDMGKVKKVKHKHYSDHRFNGNIFQDEQTRRNKEKTNWSDIKVGDNNPFFSQASQASSHNSHYRI